jgi:hypothetical protein
MMECRPCKERRKPTPEEMAAILQERSAQVRIEEAQRVATTRPTQEERKR